MITPDQEERLQRLEAYVVEATDKSPKAFWEGFEEIAHDLDKEVFALDADASLLECYTSLLANADEAGFMVPAEAMDNPTA